MDGPDAILVLFGPGRAGTRPRHKEIPPVCWLVKLPLHLERCAPCACACPFSIGLPTGLDRIGSGRGFNSTLAWIVDWIVLELGFELDCGLDRIGDSIQL